MASDATPKTQQPPSRKDVRFPSGEAQCAAWLYLPAELPAGRRVPVIVMAHGLGAVKTMRLAAFAERFRDTGYACLVFDYRYFGDSSGEPRELLDIPSQLADWRAAVAYARSLPEIDPERVIIWGTSFGGGHAIVTAAEDTRVAAAISQCPFTDGLSSSLAVGPLTSLKLGFPALLDMLGSWMGRKPLRVGVVGLPGEVALMTSPDAWEGVQGLLRASGLTEVPRMVPARVALQIPLHTPGRWARRVRCPILFSVCLGDSVAPARATLRHAARAPRGEIRQYPEGHFDIYVGEPFERNVADQIAFLKAHVPA